MITVVLIMTAGIIAGILVRGFPKLIKANEHLTMWAIYALLFVMGLEIGTNNEILSSLHTLGVKALIIAIAGVLGSVITAYFTYRIFFKNKNNAE